MKRKIIQIAVLLEGNCHYLYALCHDGSLWQKSGTEWGAWRRVDIDGVIS